MHSTPRGWGCEGKVELEVPATFDRPRPPRQLAAELAERVDADLERGFTGHGPHRDDLAFKREGRELRAYGSRGQQRLGLLALLLAEREELAAAHGAAPLLLLDDVMSELDVTRRGRLVELLRQDGQAVITTTELAHVPGGEEADVARIAITPGNRLARSRVKRRTGAQAGLLRARPAARTRSSRRRCWRPSSASGRRPPVRSRTSPSPSPSATGCSSSRATAPSGRTSSR